MHTLFAKSKEIAQPKKGSPVFLSLWLGGALEWLATDWLGVSLHPALHYFLSRPEFHVDPYGRIHKPTPVAGVLKIGLFLHF
jgi:hypothetical protein